MAYSSGPSTSSARGQKRKWHEGFQLTEVPQNTRGFAYVVDKVDGAVKIKRVFQINNDTTWTSYKYARERAFRECGGMWLCERHLFHGSPNNAKTIAEKGFAQSTNGILLSDQASVSVEHSQQRGQRDSYLLLCKVALGKVGCHWIHSNNVFTIKNEKLVFPRYLIEY